MKINQLIREKRKDLSLTQEQMAAYLGVSASAVHKWEKGSTYPDITILPALARLLRTDLNTLLSFQEDLTDAEVADFVEEVDEIVRRQGYETAFKAAVNKIREYPTCENLIYSVILYLEGALFLYGVPEQERYMEEFLTYYERLAESESSERRETAVQMLISYYNNKNDFSKAEELIHSLPSSSTDREEQLAILFMRQERYSEAEKIWEQRVLNSVSDIQTALLNMMEIAIKEERGEDAAFYAEIYEQASTLFSTAKWIPLTAKFQLSVVEQNKDDCLSILRNMLSAMKEEWNSQDSPLYRRLGERQIGTLNRRLSDLIRAEMKDGEEFAFIRDTEEYRELSEEFC